MAVARLVTFNTGDNCITIRSNVTVGICMDIWHKIASDLNLTFTTVAVEKWMHMLEYLRDNKTDVILQRVEAGHMLYRNVTK